MSKSIKSNKSTKSNNSIRNISMERRIEELKDDIKITGDHKNILFSGSGRMELESSPFNIMANQSPSIVNSPFSMIRSQSKEYVVNNNEFMTMCQTPMSPRKPGNETGINVGNVANTRLAQLKNEEERLQQLIKLQKNKIKKTQTVQEEQKEPESQPQSPPTQIDNSSIKNTENLTKVLGKLGI